MAQWLMKLSTVPVDLLDIAAWTKHPSTAGTLVFLSLGPRGARTVNVDGRRALLLVGIGVLTSVHLFVKKLVCI